MKAEIVSYIKLDFTNATNESILSKMRELKSKLGDINNVNLFINDKNETKAWPEVFIEKDLSKELYVQVVKEGLLDRAFLIIENENELTSNNSLRLMNNAIFQDVLLEDIENICIKYDKKINIALKETDKLDSRRLINKKISFDQYHSSYQNLLYFLLKYFGNSNNNDKSNLEAFEVIIKNSPNLLYVMFEGNYQQLSLKSFENRGEMLFDMFSSGFRLETEKVLCLLKNAPQYFEQLLESIIDNNSMGLSREDAINKHIGSLLRQAISNNEYDMAMFLREKLEDISMLQSVDENIYNCANSIDSLKFIHKLNIPLFRIFSTNSVRLNINRKNCSPECLDYFLSNDKDFLNTIKNNPELLFDFLIVKESHNVRGTFTNEIDYMSFIEVFHKHEIDLLNIDLYSIFIDKINRKDFMTDLKKLGCNPTDNKQTIKFLVEMNSSPTDTLALFKKINKENIISIESPQNFSYLLNNIDKKFKDKQFSSNILKLVDMFKDNININEIVNGNPLWFYNPKLAANIFKNKIDWNMINNNGDSYLTYSLNEHSKLNEDFKLYFANKPDNLYTTKDPNDNNILHKVISVIINFDLNYTGIQQFDFMNLLTEVINCFNVDDLFKLLNEKNKDEKTPLMMLDDFYKNQKSKITLEDNNTKKIKKEAMTDMAEYFMKSVIDIFSYNYNVYYDLSFVGSKSSIYDSIMNDRSDTFLIIKDVKDKCKVKNFITNLEENYAKLQLKESIMNIETKNKLQNKIKI